MDRIILHCDMNSFYASVEQAEHPELRGKPVVVGGHEDRRQGIVLTKSAEAKRYGITTAETLWQARRKCPDLIVVHPHYDLYKRYSRLAREIYYDYTDLVEPFGLDECWLDLSGSLRLHGGRVRVVAREISERVKAQLGVTISIGVGWDKITAKFGSDYRKPDAITEITRANYRELFWGAPVRDLLCVGRATEKKLLRAGICTIGDLARADDLYLRHVFGKIGTMLGDFARGEDPTPVKSFDLTQNDVARGVKSYGNSMTAPHDIVRETDAKALIWLLSESVAQRLREGGYRCRCVAIAVRDAGDLSYFSRQKQLREPTAATLTIARVAWRLLTDNQPIDEDHPMRGLAVRVTALVPLSASRQLAFGGDEAAEELDRAIDELRRRFGNSCVKRGIELADATLIGREIKDEHTVHPVGYLHR